ncbi:ATPase inhibitor subunit zeta [Hansschlegelia sp. KR7-227]|uniref:ATPase inhibitor subunit zeta n=1 Tax=Hansschlegelia sp. KR7-227 TaxID=3400914 RepID=UPI003BFE7209
MLEHREAAAEARFVHERDVAFEAHARRDRMFGRWAAHLMGMKGEAVEDYARALMLTDVAQAGDDGVLDRVLEDLAEHGVVGVRASEDRLRRKLERLHATAQSLLGAGG